MKEWRLLNLAEIPWQRTQSIYHALALTQDEFTTPNTLIINWPNKSFVCIGLHQIIDLVIETDYLEKENIPFLRRSCGGGSVYLDSNQVFYQIICKEKEFPMNLEEFYKFFLKPVVKTYQYYKIPAQYAPINDIVASGRKISGNGAVTFGNSRVLVGNFIFKFPSEKMSKILKVPDEKFRDKIAKSLEERMGSFSLFLEKIPKKEEVVKKFIQYFEKELKIKLIEKPLLKEELAKIEEIEELYTQKKWIYYVEKKGDEFFQQKIKSGTYFTYIERKFEAGLLQLFVHFDQKKLVDIAISGDFSINPPFILHELEKEMTGLLLNKTTLHKSVEQIFNSLKIDLPGITPKQLSSLILEKYNEIRK